MNDNWLHGPDGLRLNPARRQCCVNDQPLELDRITFDLLEALLRRQGTFTSPAELVNAVWGFHEDRDFQFVYRAIARLRRQLTEAGVTNAIDSAGFVLKRGHEPAPVAAALEAPAAEAIGSSNGAPPLEASNGARSAEALNEAPVEATNGARPLEALNGTREAEASNGARSKRSPWFARINLEMSTTSIIAFDADRHIIWANAAAETFTGYTVAELVALPSGEDLTPIQHRDACQVAWDAVRQGDPLRGNTLIETKDRGCVPALASWHSLNIDGQFFAFIELWPVNDGSALTRVRETAQLN